VGLALANQVIEVRVSEEDRVIATVSDGTLAYMYRHGLVREHRLRNHRGNLDFAREDERDLFEGMRLAERLSAVSRNIDGASRRNERLRSEIVRRAADGRPDREGTAWGYSLSENGWRGDDATAGGSDSVVGGG
jgi:hypothetical protein